MWKTQFPIDTSPFAGGRDAISQFGRPLGSSTTRNPRVSNVKLLIVFAVIVPLDFQPSPIASFLAKFPTLPRGIFRMFQRERLPFPKRQISTRAQSLQRLEMAATCNVGQVSCLPVESYSKWRFI